jgi:hypothetical protein
MTDDQFDDALKNKIRDHHSAVPDDMWERIIQKKDKDRKGFFFFFGWSGILILAVALGGYLLSNYTSRKLEPEIHELADSAKHTGQTIVPLDSSEANVNQNSILASRESTMAEKTFYGQAAFKRNKNKQGARSSADNKNSPVYERNETFNPSLQKDSLIVENKDSSISKQETAVALLTVKKPSPGKSIEDSSKNAIVKKTEKDTILKKWYLDMYASPDFPIDNTPNSPSIYSGHTKLSYTIGIRLNRAFSKHFSGKIGIQYSHINLADSGILNLTSFDLPVLAGYSFGNEKLRMTFTAGVIANLSSSSKGYAANELFKSNTGFSLYGGFNFEKKINQKFSIYLEPYYRYRLSSMTVSTYDIYKFIDVVGLSIGGRYYFLKSTKK